MDKTMTTFSNSRPLDYGYQSIQQGSPWQPGFVRRTPWAGLGAMFGALFGVLAGVLVLYFSNNQPIEDWTVQPTVYLAIASAATNVFLHFALTEAVTIAWWCRAMKSNTSFGDLHRTWDFGQSLWAAVTSGLNFNAIALASILVALVPINGPLLQRASHIRHGHFEQETSVNIPIAEDVPDNYTGFLSNRANEPALLTSTFVDIVQDFNQRVPVPLRNSTCKGLCSTSVAGAGLVANCSESTHPIQLDGMTPPNGSQEEQNQVVQEIIDGTDVFGTYLLWPSGDMLYWPGMTIGTFNLGVQFKEKIECNSELTIRNCTFRPATVIYPVVIDGSSSTISLTAGTNISDDKIVKVAETANYTYGEVYTFSSFNVSTYGGFFKALSDSYTSVVHMDFGAIGFEIFNNGALSNRYVNTSSTTKEGLNCTLNFRDPTDDIIANMRELMFRTAIASADINHPADLHNVPAHESFSVPVWTSSFLFLGLAVVVSLLGWIATVPVFLGWWHLGRTVSMSPIEIARAFGAPSLKNHDSNSNAKTLLEDVGRQKVQYGASTLTTGRDASDSQQSRSRLLMSGPDLVRSPKPGEILSG